MKRINGVPVFSDLAEILDPSHSALLVVDVQNDMCRPDGWMAQQGRDVTAIMAAVPRMARLVAAARDSGVAVVLVEQTTLPDNASDSPAWLYFKTRDGRARTDYTLEGSWGQRTVDEIGRAPADVVVRKHRPSAFHATNLDVVLRARAIQSVVVCGTITQGCVQATVMDASFHDYYVVVAGDAVQSFSPELHENALAFMRSRYDIASCAEIAECWQRPARAVA